MRQSAGRREDVRESRIPLHARTGESETYSLRVQLTRQTAEGIAQREVLKCQGELVETLSARAKDIRSSKDQRSKKIEKLRSYIADPKHGLSPLSAPLPLPLNARVLVTSIAADKSSVIKSNLFPLLLWFETIETTRPPEDDLAVIHPDYPIIFKHGDDLRQDQLVIQLFTLMDRLLRKENLDLKLSPYNVLATSINEGMIQFVPSKSLAAIMAEYGNLQNYLRQDHADDGALGSYGIEAGVMDTFVRSCGECDKFDAELSHRWLSRLLCLDVCARYR